MGYQDFSTAPKDKTKSEDIGRGQINLEHLSPALYTEFRKITLHSHSGSGSKRIQLNDLEGTFPINGFYMRDTDGVRWRIYVDTSGVLQTEAA